MPLHLTAVELQDLRGARVLQLTDRDGDGVPDEGVLTRAIENAELEAREILIALRYREDDLPATPETTEAGLKDAIADLVLYHVLKGTGAQISEQTLILYKEAKARLRTIGMGGGTLALPGQPAVDSPATPRGLATTAEAGLSLKSLEEW